MRVCVCVSACVSLFMRGEEVCLCVRGDYSVRVCVSVCVRVSGRVCERMCACVCAIVSGVLMY